MSIAYRDLERKLLADLYRVSGRVSAREMTRQIVLGDVFKINVLLRLCEYSLCESHLRRTVFPCFRLLLRHYSYKYGVEISPRTEIGPGLFIGHPGTIVISPFAKIGANCNLSHGVTIGVSNRGQHVGYPTIGDNVYLGPGAKVFGGISVESGCAVGANCVVTRDLPPRSVAVGVPARVASSLGSEGYVNNTDYWGEIVQSQKRAGRLRRMLLRK